jgi:ABC-2 type transport system permease protein
MWGRVRELLGARLAAQGKEARVPLAALTMQAFVAGVLCGLVRDALPPYGYALFALSVSGALVAIPLLGELGSLLLRDEADLWVRALPVAPRELRLARLLHLLLALGMLSLGSLVPAALLADARVGLLARAVLILAGLGQSLLLAAILLAIMATLRGRAQALLVLVQTALFVGIVVGATTGLRHIGAWSAMQAPQSGAWALFPPAWFAAPLAEGPLSPAWRWAALLATAAALLVLVLQPSPPAGAARSGEPLLGRALYPLRALARLAWVRRDERGVFEWVFEALPKEREFVLRTYPLVGIPLAFLLVGARGADRERTEALLALLLFTPGTYLPILLAHVPVSASHSARWILDCAPIERAAVQNGALKAIAVRFVAPLYLLLGLLSCLYASPAFALRLAPLAFLVSLAVLRTLSMEWPLDPPLSTAPEDVEVRRDWFNVLLGLALVLTLVAIALHQWLDSPALAAALAVALIAAEFVQDRRSRGERRAVA